jgi:fido (protein-threonine AMPylation protein)
MVVLKIFQQKFVGAQHSAEFEEQVRRKKFLTDQQRVQVYEALLQRSNNLKLKRTTTTIVAHMFNIHRSLVQTIWRKAKQCHYQGIPVDLTSKSA